MRFKILMSNLGYAKGISGSLEHHMKFAYRHFYCTQAVQERVMYQVNGIIERENPDICCFVEIDKGSFSSAHFNQIKALVNERYPYFDIETKYGQKSWLRSFVLTQSKSNAFLAKRPFRHEKIYFNHGAKRLIYKVMIGEDVTLFFAHFSLSKKTRALQLQQIRELVQQTPGEIILLGDFNILTGFQELEPMLKESRMKVISEDHKPTFRFHKQEKVLDLCICTQEIAQKVKLDIIPQPYSDHAALVVEMSV